MTIGSATVVLDGPPRMTRRRSEKVSGLAAGVLPDQGPESGSMIERG